MDKRPTAADEVEAADAAKGAAKPAVSGDQGAGPGAAVAEVLQYSQYAPSAGNFKWTVCALLFFATTVNYMDRSVLGVLEPMLREKIGWDSVQYGNITAAFSAAYAVGL